MIEQAIALRHPAAVQSVFALIPDQRLVKLAARGSTPAFATIYRRHHKELYRYCRSLLGNDDDAGDALQNTMLQALRGLEGERREIALRPWLFRIAHNESVSLMRSRDRATPVAPEEVARAGGSDDLEGRERFAALISDIGQLSGHQRSALVMRELSGLEFGEIAAALETSPEAAKQAVYQARVALGELAEGRDMSCDEIRRKVSAEDRRLLRGRRVRAHLRGCSDCRAFEHQIRERSRALAGLAPTISVPGAAAVLQGALGGGAGAAGAGTASLLGAAAGAKAIAAAAAALAVGAGLYVADRQDTRQSTDRGPAASSPEPASAGSNRDRSTDRAATTGAHGRAAGLPAVRGAGNAPEGEGGSSARNGSNTAGGGGSATPGASGADVPAHAPAASGTAPVSSSGPSGPVGGGCDGSSPGPRGQSTRSRGHVPGTGRDAARSRRQATRADRIRRGAGEHAAWTGRDPPRAGRDPPRAERHSTGAGRICTQPGCRPSRPGCRRTQPGCRPSREQRLGPRPRRHAPGPGRDPARPGGPLTHPGVSPGASPR